MMKILITGGTGLVGRALTSHLESKGHEVSILSRYPDKDARLKEYYWNSLQKKIDEQALQYIDCIIHLAGANIAEKRWTKRRKIELYESRVGATKFLFSKIKELNVPLKSFITASAIGWYGNETTEDIYDESIDASTDFLGQLCEDWEIAADRFASLGVKVSKVRTGVVLSDKGGALEKMCKPIIWGQGAPLGSGKQYIPWIHIEDLCEIYTQLVEYKLPNGVYNAVAPEHITNEGLTKLLAQALEKPLWMPNIPSWALYMLLGRMSSMLLNGSRVSSKKIIESGFTFRYPTITRAIASILD